MGAPKGNQFWLLRSKHGRDKLFISPELLWQAACEYFQWCIDNPLIEIDYRGKDTERVELPKMRAFTLVGLYLYLDINNDYLTDFKDSLKGKKDDMTKEFSRVITRIYDTIYKQKFEGAAAGFLNANIIARDLGLVDKATVENRVTVQPPDLSVLTDKELDTLDKLTAKLNRQG